jgi:Peptidase family M41/AAA domain (Cdc48 subfamily)/C-terminal, D2-small domain, of ClpB protein
MQFDKKLVALKKELLNKAVIQLKTEFIGIDAIIDELADLILPWWLFPENQIRPLIVNLWGMTGSGKTALIQRLSEQLAYNKKLLRFDMGEFGASSSFLKYTLTRQLNQFNEGSPIIVLDEFQFAKTKDENQKEVNNTSLRIIWDLLDSGQVTYEPDGNTYYLTRARKMIKLLEEAVRKGIKVKDGIVTEHADTLKEVLYNFSFGYIDSDLDREDGKKPFSDEEYFVSDEFCNGLYDIDTFLFNSYKHVADIMRSQKDLPGIIKFIQNLLDDEYAFKVMDLSKSLVFVVGNLDEAFSMSNSINPDIDADEYRRYTMKITIANIKTALQSRFRNEQIARLGNNHLIYHAFSNQNFSDLISLHLDKISALSSKKFNIKIEFTPSVHVMLYSEGVFPTQGVRPIISTIRNLIESHLTKIVLHVLSGGLGKLDKIVWDFVDDQFVITFIKKGQEISQMKFFVLQKINSLRKSVKNDLQAMVAVHETGHTMASMFLVKVLPEYVITRTVDSDSEGFAYIILPDDIVTKRLLLDQIRIGLGGYAAEKLIFGAENNTTGVSHDLSRVSSIAHQIVREYGMADKPYKINLHQYGGNPYQFTFTPEHEAEAKQLITNCLVEVEQALKEHKPFLLTLAKYLSGHSRINKDELFDMVSAYALDKQVKLPEFVDKTTYYNYTKLLDGM